MPLGNDTRGWIMTCISGVACVLGAAIICADLIIRLFPGKKNFKIQDSDAFLSSSLSLSFGVMLFSSLYSMLPSAKKSLQEGGFSPKVAAWTLIACFLGGAIGIQIISRILHNFIPSHVVDCEHTHDEEEHKSRASVRSGRSRSVRRSVSSAAPSGPQTSRPVYQGRVATDHPDYFSDNHNNREASLDLIEGETFRTALTRKPSLQSRLTSTITKLVSEPKDSCDADGPCYGFSEPCGQECFKIVQARGSTRSKSARSVRRPLTNRSRSTPAAGQATEVTPLLANLGNINEESPHRQTHHSCKNHADDIGYAADERQAEEALQEVDDVGDTGANGHDHSHLQKTASASSNAVDDSHDHHHQSQHHHHVPTNAFLSIGLQTSIAIALHKLPEGFITYATNHANPKLGFAVFLALFIHNITEGFAMALPLYLALNSRWKAMFWSSLLGGFSQPLGAGVAAIWFKVAGKGDMAPGEGVYGCMFAITSGIMASVALQLFSESLDLTHNRNLCMIFAFIGMGILGISSALTA